MKVGASKFPMVFTCCSVVGFGSFNRGVVKPEVVSLPVHHDPSPIWAFTSPVEKHSFISVLVIPSSIERILLPGAGAEIAFSVIQGIVILVVHFLNRFVYASDHSVHPHHHSPFVVVIHGTRISPVVVRCEPWKIYQLLVSIGIYRRLFSSREPYPTAWFTFDVENCVTDFGAWLGHLAEIAALRSLALFPAAIWAGIVTMLLSVSARITSRLDSLFAQVHDSSSQGIARVRPRFCQCNTLGVCIGHA